MNFLKNLKPIHYLIGILLIIGFFALAYYLNKSKTDSNPDDTSADVTVYKVEITKSDDPPFGKGSCDVASCFCTSGSGENVLITWHMKSCGSSTANQVKTYIEFWDKVEGDENIEPIYEKKSELYDSYGSVPKEETRTSSIRFIDDIEVDSVYIKVSWREGDDEHSKEFKLTPCPSGSSQCTSG